MSNASNPEPMPTGSGEVVLFEVQRDILERAGMGHRKYGTFLRTQNNRDALTDAYQEAIDLVMYLRQLRMDLDAKDDALSRLLVAILNWINAAPELKLGAELALIRMFQDTHRLLTGYEWNEYPEVTE